jgi:hypothetical protein
MTSVGTVETPDNSSVVSELVEISRLDTLYRDLYLETARNLMEPLISYESFVYVRDGLNSLDLVERQLRGAVQRGDWKRSSKLAEQVKSIKKSADRRELLILAQSVYDKLSDVPIDPFAPGFDALLRNSSETLRGLKHRATELLTTLEFQDPGSRDFYTRRKADIESVTIGEQFEEKKKAASEVDLRQEAINAVDSGDLSSLEEIIEKLKAETDSKEGDKDSPSLKLGEAAELGDDLHYSFTDAAKFAARELGLSTVRTRSRREFAHLIPYKWSPAYLTSESKHWARDQVSRLSIPVAETEAVREAIELYLFNPLVNSGGTRYQVCMVEEDLLLEDFDEPEPRSDPLNSKLVAELGLSSRWGLTRIELENALLQNGPRILKETLQLDPEAFRIVAIPPDIYTSLGPDRGWGQQEMWTHFDGYWVQEGKLQALAGGDKRFGGTHDVVCFSPNYSSEKLLARFAVVQRKRMESWQRK